MNAINPVIENVASARLATPSTRRPGLLGVLALLLWVAAVCLGIIVPLAGVHVDTSLVIAVLIASGIASLLSLPAAAGFLGRGTARSKAADDRARKS